MKIGIIKERKTPPDRRVVFTPKQLYTINKNYPNLELVVEPSDIRVFSDTDYDDRGIRLTDDLTRSDILLGVKEVPPEHLIPNKSYFFFSHTIKKQPYNRELLQEILRKNINLFDHETLVDNYGKRLIGFGRYAGIVGAYNGFRAYGKREKTYDLPKVEELNDYRAVKQALEKHVRLPAVKIVLTGRGKVAKGAREIIEALKIKEVGVDDYLSSDFDEAVFCQISYADYTRKKDGSKFTKREFYDHPERFESDFMRFAEVSDMLFTGHFHGEGNPYLFTRDDAKQKDFNIDLIADITCDIDGPVASTIRPSTVAEPFYGYSPQDEKETDFDADDAITVMAVDNLPCELPKDASQGFGAMFFNRVLPAIMESDPCGILKKAQITKDGQLTDRFAYLQDYVDGKE